MKTIEEAAEELYPLNKPTMFTQFVAGLEQSAFKSGVEFAQRWISVEDELPNIGDHILIWLKRDKLKIWRIFNEDDRILVKNCATRWRPIELK